MNVLVLGSGGREHAICWKIKESSYLKKLFSIPGNGGISEVANVYEIKPTLENIKRFVEEKEIDIVIPGPEKFLVDGVSDYLNVPTFGPSKNASLLEGSKVFAKNFMKKYDIPTANFEIFDDPLKAKEYIKNKNNLVIKADGLCAGKGVFVCEEEKKMIEAIDKIMIEKIFGSSGDKVVIEEKLIGEEASILVLLNRENYTFLIPSQDHKQVYDGDKGPNTGGMGAYAPTKLIDDTIMKKIEDKIVKRLINGLKIEEINYCGVLYLGLMIVEKEPFVLEFNIRFGDPETQAILPLLEDDLLEIILKIMEGEKLKLKWKDGYSVCVVLASKGYPGEYEKGKEIKFSSRHVANSEWKDIIVFHAGTKKKNGKFYTNGGRVLNICGRENSIKKARETVYSFIEENVYFEGMHYRRDIGLKEERRE
ncbi:MAG: phosphoribosylamine--glycine ligase [Caldiserica bacterium]|nr:MAG: phosphoribosylamine--glycine ligase [Caldisericota bacterium]